jgi:hypothetical protein
MITNKMLMAGGSGFITHSIDLNGSDEWLSLASPPAGTSRKIFTLSFWIKRDSGGATPIGTNNVGHYLRFIINATIPELTEFNSPTTHLREVLGSDANPTTWTHYVCRVDTSQATAADRVRIYIDNTVATPTAATNPTLNYDTLYGNQHNIEIGRASSPGDYLNGKLTYIAMVDGQSLAPTSFGQTIGASWKPKRYTGTFGNAGFQLLFKDSANLGKDSSGNNNDFTLNNIDSSNRSTDIP